MRISDWSSDVCSSDLAENLHLDMARGQDIFLDKHMVVAERRRRLALARGERVGEIRCRIDLSHTLAAAARTCFDETGIADPGRLFGKNGPVVVLAHLARRPRHPGSGHLLLRSLLQTQRGNTDVRS